MRRRLFLAAVSISAIVSGGLVAGSANGPRFFRDDPIARDPETEDAQGVREAELSQLYDFAENSFLGAGEEADVRAVNINTVDEVPDSSWFTNRLGREPWTPERLVKGPDTLAGTVRNVDDRLGQDGGPGAGIHGSRRDGPDSTS